MIEFYDDYFSKGSFSESNEAYDFKDEYVRNKLKDNFIYKFIPFTEDDRLNKIKLSLLKEEKLWLSNYKNFEDKNELRINCNIFTIARKTKQSQAFVKNIIDMGKQLNDVSCFTYEITKVMWEKYANQYNGFCLKFYVEDTDMLFPIVYTKKQNINFTNDYIYAINYQNRGKSILSSSELMKISILPWVLKDKEFEWENELRLICGDVYDSEDGPLGGRVFPEKKELIGYNGIAFEYKKCGIKLEEIIVGNNCSNQNKDNLKLIIHEKLILKNEADSH